MAQELALYLRLSPEFGGTRFGPFEGAEVKLGSAPAPTNDIVLPEALGVASAHVRIYRQQDLGLIVAPVDRTAAVYVWQGRAPKPKQINTPVAVRTGDSFALVTAQGPRFFVELDELPEQVKKQREAQKSAMNRARGRLSVAAFKKEGVRQVWVRILSTGLGQMGQRAYTFVRSGAIFMPRNIFMMVGIAGGWIFGGAQRCSSLAQKAEIGDLQAQIKSKDDQIGVLQNLSDADSPEQEFSSLLVRITGATELGSAIKNDQALLKLVEQKAALLFQNADEWSWLTNPKEKAARVRFYSQVREGLAKKDGDLDPDTLKIMAWAAALPDLSQEGWTALTDSNGEQACAKGVMGLTWRQARNLGLTPALDAYIKGAVSEFEGDGSRQARQDALLKTARSVNPPESAGLEGDFQTELLPVRTGREYCLSLKSDADKRDKPSDLVNAVVRHLGKDAPFVPEAGESHAVTARVAKWYAADIDTVVFSERKNSGLDLSAGPVGATLSNMGPQGAWVLDRTAETIARSVVLPCVAVLKHSDNAALKTTFGEGNLPQPVYCLIADWQLRQGK